MNLSKALDISSLKITLYYWHLRWNVGAVKCNKSWSSPWPSWHYINIINVFGFILPNISVWIYEIFWICWVAWPGPNCPVCPVSNFSTNTFQSLCNLYQGLWGKQKIFHFKALYFWNQSIFLNETFRRASLLRIPKNEAILDGHGSH